MSFQAEFVQALESGKTHEALWQIVRSHQAEFETSRQCYDALEKIWLQYGFDSSSEESSLRDELEFMLEKTWYGGLTEVQTSGGKR